MNARRLPDRERLRDFYDRVAPTIVLTTLVGTFVCSILAVLSIQTDNRQDEATRETTRLNVEQNRSILTCLDAYVGALSTALPPVRTATINRDEAQAAYQDTQQQFAERFENLLTELMNVGQGDLAPLRASLAAMRRAGAALARAQERLAIARAEYPYPKPSQFCDSHGPPTGPKEEQ